jgi:hypothetical protein
MQGWAKLAWVDDATIKEAFYGFWELTLPCQLVVVVVKRAPLNCFWYK